MVRARSPPIRTAGIQFADVTFAYASGLPPALRDVSFDVPAGHTVALVGRSGEEDHRRAPAPALLGPQTGQVRIGGRDVRDLRLDDLRGLIALVAQDTYLFNASLRDNIRLGRPSATDDEVVAAARACERGRIRSGAAGRVRHRRRRTRAPAIWRTTPARFDCACITQGRAHPGARRSDLAPRRHRRKRKCARCSIRRAPVRTTLVIAHRLFDHSRRRSGSSCWTMVRSPSRARTPNCSRSTDCIRT